MAGRGPNYYRALHPETSQENSMGDGEPLRGTRDGPDRLQGTVDLGIRCNELFLGVDIDQFRIGNQLFQIIEMPAEVTTRCSHRHGNRWVIGLGSPPAENLELAGDGPTQPAHDACGLDRCQTLAHVLLPPDRHPLRQEGTVLLRGVVTVDH